MARFAPLCCLILLSACATSRYSSATLELSLSPLPPLVTTADGSSEMAERGEEALNIPAETAGSENEFLYELARFQKKARFLAKPTMTDSKRETFWLSYFTYFSQILDGSLPLTMAALHRLRLTVEAEFQYMISICGLPDFKVLQKERQLMATIHKHINILARRPKVEQPLILEWPIDVMKISSFFGYREDPFTGRTTFHRGMDLAAPSGRVVYSAAAGKVIRAGWFRGHGQSVTIEHSGGYVTVYSHLSAIFVSPGEDVEQRSTIGLVGNTGRSTGPHLHFEVHFNGRVLDPLEVVEMPLTLP